MQCERSPRWTACPRVVMSVVATTLGMLLYSIVSYVVTRSRYKGRRLLDLAAWVPWAVPSLILGLGILWTVLLSPLAVLYGTLTVMILAHIVRGFPFGDELFDFVASHSKVFVVEQNRDAQLKTLLVNDAGINPASLISILHYDGTPITARFIQKEIAEIVAALNVRPIKKDKAA